MAEKMTNNFLKYAYEKGKVRDVLDAFDEFNPAEEAHGGKADYWLKEEEEIYSYYEVGDIVFVGKYQYANGQMGQNHLFVIVEQNNLAIPVENFGMLISSKIEKVKFGPNRLLKADAENHLKTDSIVKTDVVYRIRNEQILFKIGCVDDGKVEEYKQCFFEENKD